MPKNHLALACGLFLASSSFGACDVTIKDGDVSFDQLHGRATQEWNRQYPLAAGGRVEVVNSNGHTEVGVGKAGGVEVIAVLSARAMTDERAKELLSDARIEESLTPEHIKLTTVRGKRSGGLEVSYRLTVPPDARVEMTSNNGTVKVDGLRGHVRAMVANGAVELTGIRGSVDAASVNGSVSVKMAEVAGACPAGEHERPDCAGSAQGHEGQFERPISERRNYGDWPGCAGSYGPTHPQS